MHERKVALTAWASRQGTHAFYLDDLVDDAIFAGDTGMLPAQLDRESRHFVDLLTHYVRDKRTAELKLLAAR